MKNVLQICVRTRGAPSVLWVKDVERRVESEKTVYDLLGAIRYQLSIFKFMNIWNSDANRTL